MGGGLRYRVTETQRTGQGFYLSVILLPFLIYLTCLSLYLYSVWMSDCLWSFFYISAEFCHPIFLTVLLLCFFDCLSVFRRKFSCWSWSWRKWRRRGMSWGSIVTDWKARLVLKFNSLKIKLRLTFKFRIKFKFNLKKVKLISLSHTKYQCFSKQCQWYFRIPDKKSLITAKMNRITLMFCLRSYIWI